MMASIQPPLRWQRSKLFRSCAVMAMATAIALPQKARAQVAPGAFQGTPTTALGSVTYDRATVGTETITLNSSNATINWSPYDSSGTGPIDFLPSGNVATFVNNPSATLDYTVLNRIVPTDPSRTIEINGQIVGQITDGINTSTGGHIWFYSPGGILIGSGAVIDVGGLLLTTADLPSGFTADSSGFSADFSAPSGSTSAIQILGGAQINALQQNSYVALVAPRIEQGGAVKIDGSAAYVAATSLSMTMNQGLFDIQVDVGGGTDDAEGIVHSGSTTGGDTASLSANHRAYMVAVPKNQALTMLLGGTAGFDASVAGYENGQIVLATGYNLNDLAGDLERSYNPSVDQPGDIDIGPGTYLSDLTAISNGSIDVGAGAGNIDFKGDLALNSYDAWDGGTVTLGASNGNTLNVGGDVSLYSANPLFQPATQLKLLADPGSSILIGGDLDMTAQFYPGYGGSAKIDAFGGTIAIGGVATVNVDGIDDPAINYGDQRRGGSIDVSSTDFLDDQGSITANGMILSANGVGHANSGVEDWQLVDATGGTINVNTGQGGELLVNGNFSAVASAFAGQQSTVGLIGGEAHGGEIHVGSAGGAFHITGDAALNADGAGGAGATGIDAGAGYGGIADFFSVGDDTLQVDGDALTSASGTGGNGQNGGFGQGGHSGVGSTGGSVIIGGNIYAAAEGTGGNASAGFGGTGGNARGGVAYVEADSSEGGTAGSIAGTTATISSNAAGGTGGAGNGDTIAAGAGGSAAGGLYEGFNTGGSYALADINGATLSLTSVSLTSSAIGGNGGAGGTGQAGGLGGDAIGGTAQAGTYNPTATTDRTGSGEFADVSVLAAGQGGSGGIGNGANDGDGGTGTGGGAIFAASGNTTATYVSLNANGTGGNGANGGTGHGGSGDAGGVLLSAAHDSNMTITGGVDLYAIGQGGFASTGAGGTGFGGDAVIQVLSGGSITGGDDGFGGSLPTGDIWVFNKGQGGDGGTSATGGVGGDGYGGNTWLLVDGALHTGETVFRTLGVGGTGGVGTDGFGGNGGYGQGGTTIVTIGTAGSFDSWEFTGFANGVGGDVGLGTTASGNGGSAQGGSNTVTIDGEASAIGCLDCGPDGVPLGFVVTAYGFAANGQNGGYAAGGHSSITINGSLTSGSIVQATGQAGAGSGVDYGGDADGGSGSITVNGDLAAYRVFVGANATGGTGSTGGVSEPGGGTAYAGNATLTVNGSMEVSDWTFVQAIATGGNSESGIGGDAEGGFAQLNVAGSLLASNINLDSSATGGNASTGDGGYAYGGESEAQAIGGGSISTTDLTVQSNATGGNGINGGDAYAGIADAGAMDSADSTLTVTNMANALGNGIGGAGLGTGSGGDGYGGDTGIHAGIDETDIGGTATFNDAVVQANGTGGTGGTAGSGYGGQGHAGTRDGTFILTGGLTGEAIGTGGLGIGGSGGTGAGGDFLLGANFDSDVNPASTTIASADVSAIGFGGTGGQGAPGGDGYGGTVTIAASIANSSLSIGTLNANAKGQGGNGGDGANGGAGGYGYGGSILTSILGTASGGGWAALVRGVGGDGGAGSEGVGGNGGYGEGGATSFYAGTESSIDAASYSTSANGVGGAGGTGTSGRGDGGEAQGGYNEATFEGTDNSFSGQFLVTAFALGGDGANGGDAFGGTSQITVNGAFSANYVQSTGQAEGGAGLAGAGGQASGGSAAIDNLGSLTAGGVFVGAVATGGNGTTGGNALGGSADLYSTGSLNSTDVSVTADANGGSSAGGVGGGAAAGEAIFESRGNLVSAGDIFVSSDGEGGDGSLGGGTGSGYSAALRIAGGTAQLTGTTTVRSAGAGGNSTGAAGGDGFGGYARTSTYGGAVSTLNALTVDSSGAGGNGLSGGAGHGSVNVGGWGGSTAQTLDPGSQMNLTGQTKLVSNGFGGAGSAGTGGDGSGGTTHLTANGQPITAQSVLMVANGTGGAGASAGGNALGGNSILFADAPVTISGATVIQANATASGGGETLGGSVSVTAGSASFADATFTAFGNGGTVDLGNINATGHLVAESDGDTSFGNVSAGQVKFDSGGAVAGGNITAASRVTGDAEGAISLGDITVGPSLPTGDDFSVGIASATSIDVGNVSGPGNVGFATLGDFNAGNVSGGGLLMTLIGGDIAVGSLTTASTGQVYMGNASMFLDAGGPDDFDPSLVLATSPVPTGGSITIGGPVSTGTFRAASAGDFTAGLIDGGAHVLLVAGGNLSADSIGAAIDVLAGAGGNLTVGDVDAGTNASFVAEGLARFLGTVDAPTIVVASGDIDIADGASLGVKGATDLVTLAAINDSVEIGGTASNPDSYHLTEDGDISASSLVLNVIGSGEGVPSVTIHDVGIDGSQTAGGGVGSVALNTPGSVLVDGHVSYTNASASDVLAINAGDSIAVNTDGGSIAMTGSGGALAGTLTLTAHNVWVADGALLAQLRADPNFAGRDAALATNNGAANPGGYLQAGGVIVTMTGSSFLVQNSGSSGQPAGLTVGDAGLTIFNTGADAASVILSGRQVKSGGTVVDGSAFAEEVNVQSAGGLTSDSSINGCAVGGCPEPQPEPQPEPAPPPQVLGAESILGPVGLVTSPDNATADQGDDSKDDEDKKSGSKSGGVDPAVYLINTGPMHLDQIIDQPITSGNDSPGGLN